MSLGHGRAGHLPDYSSVKYRYLPAWGQYEEIIKDNPSDYMHAFCQMIYVIKYLRGEHEDFVVNTYDEEAVAAGEERVDNAKADADEAGKELKETVQNTAEGLSNLVDPNKSEGGGADE